MMVVQHFASWAFHVYLLYSQLVGSKTALCKMPRKWTLLGQRRAGTVNENWTWRGKRNEDEMLSWSEYWFVRGPYKFRRIATWSANVNYVDEQVKLMDVELE
jgi:hypothetical protein